MIKLEVSKKCAAAMLSTVLFGTFAAASAPGAAFAAGAGGEKKPTEAELQQKKLFELPKLGDVYIQFNPLMAPVDFGKRGRRSIPLTVLLTITDNEKIGLVCNKAARVNNALLSVWFKKPISHKHLRTDKDDLYKRSVNAKPAPGQREEMGRLIKALNKAFKNVTVKDVRVYKGMREANQGSVGKLPFGRACTLWVRKTPDQMRDERRLAREAEAAKRVKKKK